MFCDYCLFHHYL